MNFQEFLTRSITGLLFSFIILASLFFLPFWIFYTLLATILFLILCTELPQLSRSAQNYLILATCYLGVPFALLAYMAYQNIKLVQLLFVIAFCHDTAAYLVGNLIGKHLLAPSLSPKKTWEGFLGGLIAVFIVLLAFKPWALSNAYFAALSILIALVATGGDLFESWLKRCAQRKDAGTLLPGHGGLLDRFDSIIALIPLFYVLQSFLAKPLALFLH
ncbi:MAG: phosphatidate cytidylyltransferase [Candidatus Babeliales bacterium]